MCYSLGVVDVCLQKVKLATPSLQKLDLLSQDLAVTHHQRDVTKDLSGQSEKPPRWHWGCDYKTLENAVCPRKCFKNVV